MIKEIKDGIAILQLNKPVMAAVAARPSAKKWGFVILAVPPVVNLLLLKRLLSSTFFPYEGFSAIFSRFLFWPMIIPTLSFIGAIFAMSYGAEKFFKTTHNHWAFFRVLAYSSIFLWLTIVPFLFGLLGILDPSGLFNLLSLVGVIWVFVVAYHLFLEWGKLSKQNAAIIVVGGFVAYLIFQLILGRILVGTYYRIFY